MGRRLERGRPYGAARGRLVLVATESVGLEGGGLVRSYNIDPLS